MRSDFLKKWRAQRLGVYCGIMKKKSNKQLRQQMAQRKTENYPLHPTNDLLQTVGPIGTLIIMV